jgi:hypothetical protein
MMERWNNGKMERWNNATQYMSVLPIFQYSNIPTFHRPIVSSLPRQRHDDVGVPGAIEV